MVQLQRQGEILRSQSTRACRQAVRSRSIAMKAKEAAEEANVESQQMRFTLQGLGDALDLKTQEAEDARRECENLREKLQLQERQIDKKWWRSSEARDFAWRSGGSFELLYVQLRQDSCFEPTLMSCSKRLHEFFYPNTRLWTADHVKMGAPGMGWYW